MKESFYNHFKESNCIKEGYVLMNYDFNSNGTSGIPIGFSDSELEIYKLLFCSIIVYEQVGENFNLALEKSNMNHEDFCQHLIDTLKSDFEAVNKELGFEIDKDNLDGFVFQSPISFYGDKYCLMIHKIENF